MSCAKSPGIPETNYAAARPRDSRPRHVQFQAQRHLPAAPVVGLDGPVRHDDRALMHQLEAAFRLADGLNRERPDARRARDSDSETSSPRHSSTRPMLSASGKSCNVCSCPARAWPA